MLKRSIYRIVAVALAALMLVAQPPVRALSEAEDNLLAEAKLISLGYLGGVPDAEFDEAARTALINFQIANGLDVTGELGPLVIAWLESPDAISKADYLQALAQKYADVELVVGSTGEQVARLQEALALLGYYSGSGDGVFGAGTEDAVLLYQRANKLLETGMADGATLYRIHEGESISKEDYLEDMCSKRGDSGENVKAVQVRLQELGYFSGDCSGTFGDVTANAVMSFQNANGLQSSGEIDMSTLERLYSKDAVYRLEGEALRPGNYGQEVVELAQQLSALGYYSGDADGAYDELIELAVCLAQIASGRPATGICDGELRSLLSSNQVVAAADAGEMFTLSRTNVSADALNAICETAAAQLGQPFADDEDSLFPGFTFVRYVLARNGIAYQQPEELTAVTGAKVYLGAQPPRGAVVGIQRKSAHRTRMYMSISAGDGKLIFMDNENGWIVSAMLDQLEYDDAYLWTFGAAHE